MRCRDCRRWRRGKEHNILHHQYTNVVGRDPDLNYGALRVTEKTKWIPYHLIQVSQFFWTAPFFMWMIAVHATGLTDLAHPQRDESYAPVLPDRKLKTLLKAFYRTLKKILPYSLYEFAFWPMLAGPFWWKVLWGNLTADMLRNIYSSAMIYAGHFGDDLQYFDKEFKAHGRSEMKTLIKILLLGFLITFGACGGDDTPTPEEVPPAEVVTPTPVPTPPAPTPTPPLPPDSDQDGIPDSEDNFPHCEEGKVFQGDYKTENFDSTSCAINGKVFMAGTMTNNIDTLSHLTKINGDLVIHGSDVASLSSLSNLREVTGKVQITFNVSLKDLQGLEQLETIGGQLDISSNLILENIDALKNLKSLGATLDPSTDWYIKVSNNLSLLLDSNFFDFLNLDPAKIVITTNAEII